MPTRLSDHLTTTFTGPQGPQGAIGPQGATGPQGPSSMSDGTAAAPGFPFTANTATGFYRPAANTLGFVTASVERMRIDSSGNVTGATISAPVLSGTATGTYTLGGTPSLAATALTGTIAAARLPVGSVVQVKYVDLGTINFSTNSSSFVDITGISATFTPLFSTSKVLVILSCGVDMVCDGIIELKRNGTVVKANWFGSSRFDNQHDYPQHTALYLDSPGTTSGITYSIQGKATGCEMRLRIGSSSEGSSNYTFMEIVA